MSHASSFERLLKKAREKDLGNHPTWHKLLHYRKGALGGYKSGIITKSFFFSAKGRSKPHLELEATLHRFFDGVVEGKEEEHGQCLFPARYDWLNEQLGLTGVVPPVRCERFQNWKKRFGTQSMSLIYASSYLNNPASMYGHTFLKLNRDPNLKGLELIDFAVSYAAETESRNGILFSIKGLVGGYWGGFSTPPYHVKVLEYNNVASRDLWEFRFNFNKAQIDRFVAHLWEMKKARKRYFFFNRNCSYELLPLLDVTDPSLNLTEQHRFKAIPVDTMKLLTQQKGLISDIQLRPSQVRLTLESRSHLNKEEQELAKRLALKDDPSDREATQKLDSQRQALVINTAYQYFQYKSGYQIEPPVDVEKKESNLLLALSRIKNKKIPKGDFSNVPKPHLGHGSGRWSVGWGANSNDESFEEIHSRGSFHDLADDSYGFVPGSELEMFSFRARYNNQQSNGYLEEFTFVNVTSLWPWDPWIHPLSWRVHLYTRQNHDLDSLVEGRLSWGGTAGFGLATHVLGHQKWLLYGLFEGVAEVGHDFDKGHRGGFGPKAGLAFPVIPSWRIHLETWVRRFPTGHIGNEAAFQGTQSFSLSQNWVVRNEWKRTNGYKETTFSLNHYF